LLAVVTCAVLATAGIAGDYQYGITFWLYRGFAAPRLPPGVSPPSIQSITVTSRALGGYRDTVIVVLPPGYSTDPGRRYPVLYLLHGVPGEPANFITVGGVAVTEATLIARGRMKPLILVMPTGARSFFGDSEWANGVSAGNAWETFIADDLVRVIDARYRAIPAGTSRGIAGLSEGGYGALNIGLHHPGEFALIESWSGYETADQIPFIFGRSSRLLRYNSPAYWVRKVTADLRADRTYIWFYCSHYDRLLGQNQAFARELSALRIPHYFFQDFGRGHAHTWALWRAHMARALITASERLRDG
jgi:S-formylglutathione hydrolase FrmB